MTKIQSQLLKKFVYVTIVCPVICPLYILSLELRLLNTLVVSSNFPGIIHTDNDKMCDNYALNLS
jgi:hypothetical protein